MLVKWLNPIPISDYNEKKNNLNKCKLLTYINTYVSILFIFDIILSSGIRTYIYRIWLSKSKLRHDGVQYIITKSIDVARAIYLGVEVWTLPLNVESNFFFIFRGKFFCCSGVDTRLLWGGHGPSRPPSSYAYD